MFLKSYWMTFPKISGQGQRLLEMGNLPPEQFKFYQLPGRFHWRGDRKSYDFILKRSWKTTDRRQSIGPRSRSQSWSQHRSYSKGVRIVRHLRFDSLTSNKFSCHSFTSGMRHGKKHETSEKRQRTQQSRFSTFYGHALSSNSKALMGKRSDVQ